MHGLFYNLHWSMPMLKHVQHDVSVRHSALDAESHEMENKVEMLKQVQHDRSERHPQLAWGSLIRNY